MFCDVPWIVGERRRKPSASPARPSPAQLCYCTTKVSFVECTKLLEPDAKLPVTVKLYEPGGVPPPLLPELLLLPPLADHIITTQSMQGKSSR